MFYLWGVSKSSSEKIASKPAIQKCPVPEATKKAIPLAAGWLF
jgi:hypothetical protein